MDTLKSIDWGDEFIYLFITGVLIGFIVILAKLGVHSIIAEYVHRHNLEKSRPKL